MRQKIRMGCFETNSSSQHSFTVMKLDEKYTSDEILESVYLHEGVWNIYDHEMEFGRYPFKALGTFGDKWLYACASLVNEYNDDIYKELERIAFKYVSGLKSIKLPMTQGCVPNKNFDGGRDTDDKYIQEHGKTEEELIKLLNQKEKDWGMEIDYWEGRNGWWVYDKPFTGYVDGNILSGFLEEENITLEDFLVNKKYIVIQDGDEYCEYGNFKKIGLIDTSKIDHEYPDYYED